jgi:hypothetical protein
MKLRASLCLLLPLLVSTPARAQAPPVATLTVTVVDPSGGVLPGASVTIVGVEEATKARAIEPVSTSDTGVAVLEKLAPGRYDIRAEFAAFKPGELKDVRLRAGNNKQVVVLPLKNVEDSVTVSRDPREAASDRAGQFSTALTREQIEALSDDPDELRRQLQELAPDAVFKVDSFEGGQLPPKAQIRSVRVSRDQFAAESHYAGGVFIEIITQPGVGPLRGSINTSHTGSAFESRNPFVPTKGPSASNGGGFGLSGTLLENKSSFSMHFNGSSAYTSPIQRVSLPDGTRSETLGLRQPTRSLYGYAQADYAVTKDQTVRFWFNMNQSTRRNQGIGAYDFPERGYWTENESWSLSVQHTGPIGRRNFLNTNFGIRRSSSASHSNVEAPTIRVLDAFTSGGAQQTGRQDTWNLSGRADLDYIRGIHSWRMGVSLEGTLFDANDTDNYLGSYTFGSLADYEAGRPRSFTQRLGDPRLTYSYLLAGLYVQDDIRVSRSLTFSPGLRYEAQSHLGDFNNLAPRFGFTWSPFQSGKTSIRMSSGIFYDWVSAGTYAQTLRLDGERQREINVVDPSFPEPLFDDGLVPPINRYLYSDDVEMVRTLRLSAGVQQAITPRFRVGVTYTDTRGLNVARGMNLNVPVNGVRPDPRYANVIAVVSDAELRGRSLSTNFSLSLTAPSPTASQAFFNPRRGTISGSYWFGSSRNNSDGAFTVPASNDLASEWGPASGDYRHRTSLSLSSQAIRGLNMSFSISAMGASPYTIRTGRDDNGDLVFNDRPAGVGRNSARGAGRVDMSGYFSYSVGFGQRRVTSASGISIQSVGGVLTVNTVAPRPTPRYRLGLSVRVTNLLNRTHYTGYSGVMTSPFFGQPQSATGVRKIYVSTNFGF